MKKWLPSFSYVAVDYNHDVVTLEDKTQTAIFRNNLAGTAVRLKLNNLYNPAPVTLAHADLFVRNRVSGKRRGPFTLTLCGEAALLLPAGSAPFSDPVAVEISAEDDFIVRMYFEEKQTVWSVCTTSSARTWYARQQQGDYRRSSMLFPAKQQEIAPSLASDPYGMDYTVCLSEIQVETDANAKVIALLGDSVTQMSYYSDPLCRMLYEAFPGRVTVANGGISGNRINRKYPHATLFPGEGHQFGEAAKDRMLRDLYQDFTPDILFILGGINDCSHAIAFREEPESAESIYAGLKEMIGKAHERGSRVLLATTGPFGGRGLAWREKGEEMRCRLNELILSDTEADAHIDLEALMRDPDDIHFMQDGMHMGDGVHPNAFGGEKIAAALFCSLSEMLTEE